MNQLLFTITFLIFNSVTIIAQSENTKCNCADELEKVSVIIKNSRSYKDQINNRNKKEFDKWFIQVKEETLVDQDIDHYCAAYLNKLISFIQDGHNQVYKTKESLSPNLPQYSENIDSLITLVENKNDSIVGIYYVGSTKVGLVPQGEKTWIAVSLLSKVEKWKKGSILFKIKQTEEGFEMFEFNQTGQLIYRKSVLFQGGRIFPSIWNKDQLYFFYKKKKSNFEFKEINESTDYIAISTFSRTLDLMKEIDNFYNHVFSKINKPNLIIDLRNNGGGSTLQGKPLIKFLKKNKDIEAYVIVNSFSASATELTLLKLRDLKNVTIVGENTSGKIAYGFGNQALKSTTQCNFTALLSVQKSCNSIEYEMVGISPDIYLDQGRDWIDQIIEIINKMDNKT